MRRTKTLQGVRMIKFLRSLSCYEGAEFPQPEAAGLEGGWGGHDPALVAALCGRGRGWRRG